MNYQLHYWNLNVQMAWKIAPAVFYLIFLLDYSGNAVCSVIFKLYLHTHLCLD